MSSAESQPIIICGAGIIGLSIAYYLTQLRPASSIHLFDTSTNLFSCASGRAAGFLAADWFAPSTASLGALSFRLHAELAAKHAGRATWGHAPSVAFSLSSVGSDPDGARGEDWLFDGTSRACAAPSSADGALPAWLVRAPAEALSSVDTTAQVDPEKLCRFLLARCEAAGVRIVHPATPTSLGLSSSGKLESLTYTTPDNAQHTLPCSVLVLSAGVWTPALYATLFPRPPRATLPITALSGHSLVLRSARWSPTELEPCAAAFAHDPELSFAPEIFSRAHGDIYLAGLNAAGLPLERVADDTAPDDKALATLCACAARMLGVRESELEVVRGALCHRPVGPGGRPLVCRLDGAVTGVKGDVFIAAGHGPWGISMSLGTGLVMAEMILGHELSADVSALGL